MDCRITLGNGENFLNALITANANNEIVNLIIDAEGLERIEGRVKSIINAGGRVIAIMEDGRKILQEQIVALNGIFHPDYGEC